MMKSRFETLNRAKIISVTSVTVFFALLVGLTGVTTSAIADTETLSLEARVKHLEELNETRNKLQADMSFQLTELQREVRSLTGQVEDNSFKLKQIQDRQRELYRDIENRLSGMSSKPQAGVTKTEQSSVSKASTDKSRDVTNIGINGNASREFNAAFALVRNKNYQAAIPAFDKFLQKHPNSSYSDNARFWLGQIYLVQGKTAEALDQFGLLVSDFPESSKAGAAKLKLGDIYLKQQKWDEAKVQYTAVANDSSGAEQQLARKGLDKIKKAGH